jgi:hypothetical protein
MCVVAIKICVAEYLHSLIINGNFYFQNLTSHPFDLEVPPMRWILLVEKHHANAYLNDLKLVAEYEMISIRSEQVIMMQTYLKITFFNA